MSPIPGVARLSAALLVDFPEVCRSLTERGWRTRQGFTGTRWRYVPTAAVLRALAEAGQVGTGVYDATFTPSRMRGSDNGGTFQQIADGYAPLSAEFLSAVAAALDPMEGLAATPPARIARLLALKGAPALDGRARTFDAAVLVVAVRDAERAADGVRQVVIAQSRRLGRLAQWMPEQLRVEDLAHGMTAGVVDRGELKGGGRGLYANGAVPLGPPEPVGMLVRRYRSVVLLGDPGAGKSTLLQARYLDHVAAGKTAVFARLEDLGAVALGYRTEVPTQAAAAVVAAALIHAGEVDLDEAGRRRLGDVVLAAGTLLVLDGLDEVSRGDQRRAALAVVSTLCRRSEARLLLSSRYTGYVPLTFVEAECGVYPLTDPSAFARRWFAGGSAAGLGRALDAMAHVSTASLATNPLLAVIVCFVAQEEEVPLRRVGLYERFVSLFLEQRWRGVSRSSEEIQRRELWYTRLAWWMSGGSRADPTEEWQDVVTLRAIPASLLEGELGAAPIVSDALLVPHGDAPAADPLGQPMRWLHRTMQEHLVGRAVANRLVAMRPGAIEDLRWMLLRQAWVVPLEHAVGLIDQQGHSGQLIDALIEFWRDSRCDRLLLRRISSVCGDAGAALRGVIVQLCMESEEWEAGLELDSAAALRWLQVHPLSDEAWARLLERTRWFGGKLEPVEGWLSFLSDRAALFVDDGPGPALLARDGSKAGRQWAVRQVLAEGVLPLNTDELLKGASEGVVRQLLAEAAARRDRDDYVFGLIEAARSTEHPAVPQLIDEAFPWGTPSNSYIRTLLAQPGTPMGDIDWSASRPSLEALLHESGQSVRLGFDAATYCQADVLLPLTTLTPAARVGVATRHPDLGEVTLPDPLVADPGDEGSLAEPRMWEVRAATLSPSMESVEPVRQLLDRMAHRWHWTDSAVYWMLGRVARWPVEQLAHLLRVLEPEMLPTFATRRLLLADVLVDRDDAEGHLIVDCLVSVVDSAEGTLDDGFGYELGREIARQVSDRETAHVLAVRLLKSDDRRNRGTVAEAMLRALVTELGLTADVLPALWPDLTGRSDLAS